MTNSATVRQPTRWQTVNAWRSGLTTTCGRKCFVHDHLQISNGRMLTVRQRFTVRQVKLIMPAPPAACRRGMMKYAGRHALCQLARAAPRRTGHPDLDRLDKVVPSYGKSKLKKSLPPSFVPDANHHARQTAVAQLKTGFLRSSSRPIGRR